MTNYEMLQTLLNNSDLLDSIIDHLNCYRVEMILSEYESDKFLLDVEVIEGYDKIEVVMYTATFEIELDRFRSLRSFFLRTPDRTTADAALISANIGKIIEDFLRDRSR